MNCPTFILFHSFEAFKTVGASLLQRMGKAGLFGRAAGRTFAGLLLLHALLRAPHAGLVVGAPSDVWCQPPEFVSWPDGKDQGMPVINIPARCRKLGLQRYTKFGDVGVLALSKVLGQPYRPPAAGPPPPEVSSLDLRGAHVGDAGAAALARALVPAGNPAAEAGAGPAASLTLEEVTLSHNDIGDAGAKALAVPLRSNVKLASLNLLDNHIGDAGAVALAEALAGNGECRNETSVR